ncbi:MAG: hypothetical protein R3D85_06735 [Paracoccaceae bacterium]
MRCALFGQRHLGARPGREGPVHPERLAELTATQDAILDAAAPLVAEAGMLAYATCSLLADENATGSRRFAPVIRLELHLPAPVASGRGCRRFLHRTLDPKGLRRQSQSKDECARPRIVGIGGP